MHHILEKNKRLVSSVEKKKRPPSGVGRPGSTKNRQNSEQYQKFLNSVKPEARQILETVSSIENDLRLRVQMYGPDSSSAIECLQHYVKTCNEHGMHLIKNGEFKVASEILVQCEQLLQSSIAGNYPNYKFQTYNNIAHCHNVQGNVRLSLKYLQKALQYGVEADERQEVSIQLPLVETYLNIANASSFLGVLDQALEYADGGVQVSQRQLDDVMMNLDNPSLPQDQRDLLGQQYHQQINLHVMSFQAKGSILEKMKRYDEAIFEYQQGKQVIEANYGTQHPKYIELANSMNGAKLRTKYISHSSVPHTQQFENRSNTLQVENANSLNIMTHDNVFLKEQEMMKPISQQKNKKRLLRPSSAKPPKKDSSQTRSIVQNRVNQRQNNQSTEQIYNQRAMHVNQRQLSNSNSDWHAYKERSKSPKQQIISRKDFAFKIRSNSARKSRKIQLKGSSQSNDIHMSHSSIHNNSECNQCHSQLEEIRQMHIEQQRLMNTIMQQQLTSAQSQIIPNNNPLMPQMQQTQQMPQIQMQQMGNPYQQYQQPPPQYYYPYPMPPPPHPGMYPMPPYPYPPYGYQMPPPVPFPQFSPTINNFMHQNQSMDSSKKDSPEQRPYLPHLHHLNPPRYQQYNQEAQSVTTYTDLNERDSEFADFTHKKVEINSAREQPKAREIPMKVPIKKEEAKKIQIKPQPKQPQQKPKIKPEGSSLKQKMQEAAIKIQKYFRQYRFQRLYKLMTSLNKRKFLFHKQLIAYRDEKKNKMLMLNVSLISVKQKGSRLLPDSVVFEFYKRKSKARVMEVSHKIKAFGYKDPSSVTNTEIFGRVKAFLSQLRLRSTTLQNIKKQFLENVGVYNPSYSQIEFIDPQYFTEGLQYVKNVKYEEQKSYSIKDDYEDEEINESFEEEIIEDQHSISQALLDSVRSEKKVAIIPQEPIQDVKELESKTVKVREAGYDVTNKDYKEQKTQHIEKSKTLAKNKNRKGSSSSSNSFKEEDIQDEYSIDHESILEDKNEANNDKDKVDKIQGLIKIQSHARGYLARNNLQTKILEAKSQVLTFACVKRNNIFFMVKARLLIGKKNEQTFSFIISLQSGKKTSPFKLNAKQIPVAIPDLNEYIQEAIEITFDDKTRKITNASFIKDFQLMSKKLEFTEDDLKYQKSLTDNQKMQVQSISKRSKMDITRAATIIQARIRCFLATRRRALLIQHEIICSFIIRDGENVAHIIMKKKQKKEKYVILVRNCKGKRKTTKIKIKEKLPFERCYLEESLREALVIQWNKDGSLIEKASFDSKRVNKDKIKESVNIQLEAIKDQRKEYETMIASLNKVEEKKNDSEDINEDYSDNEFDKEEVKEDFKVNAVESESEISIKEQPKEVKQQQNKATKAEKEVQVIKVQARMRGMLTRNQVQPQLEKEHTMLMRLSRTLSDGRFYNIFLLKKNNVQSTKDTFYIITMRQADNMNEIYDLELTLEMAKKIFGKKNQTKEDIQKAVMFETNQMEFQLMLECLDIKEKDDFSLDFQKFRSLQNQKQEIKLFDNEQPVVQVLKQSPKKPQPKEEIKEKEHVMKTPESQNYSQEYEVIEEQESNLETSPDPQKKAQKPKFESIIKSAVKDKTVKEDYQTRRNKAAITIQRRTRQMLTRKQYKALHSVNFTNKAKDPKKKLSLKEQGVFKLCELYFMYFIYADQLEEEVKFTLKAVSEKITIISMKSINLADFGEEKVEIFEVIEYIKEQLIEKEEELLLDEKTGELRKDWQIQLHEFIEENL